MSRIDTIDYYLDKIKNTKFELDQIRPELESKNYDPEEISLIIELVDNAIINAEISKSNNIGANELIWVGAILSIIGGIVTIGTLTNLIHSTNTIIIAYSPFVSGLSILGLGLSKKRNKLT